MLPDPPRGAGSSGTESGAEDLPGWASAFLRDVLASYTACNALPRTKTSNPHKSTPRKNSSSAGQSANAANTAAFAECSINSIRTADANDLAVFWGPEMRLTRLFVCVLRLRRLGESWGCARITLGDKKPMTASFVASSKMCGCESKVCSRLSSSPKLCELAFRLSPSETLVSLRCFLGLGAVGAEDRSCCTACKRADTSESVSKMPPFPSLLCSAATAVLVA